MLVGRARDIRSSEITAKALYLRRREFIKRAAMTAADAAAGVSGTAQAETQTWHGSRSRRRIRASPCGAFHFGVIEVAVLPDHRDVSAQLVAVILCSDRLDHTIDFHSGWERAVS